MSDSTVPALVDDRAGSADLMRYEPVRLIAELTRLDSADVCICGNGPDGPLLVGVELKNIFDVVSSAETGRLQATQIPAMLDTYQVNWLLYYGLYRVDNKGYLQVRRGNEWRAMRLGSRPVPYGYVEGLVFDLAMLNVNTRHVVDMREAAIWIAALHRWWSKPWDRHKAMRVIDKSQSGVSLMPEMSEEVKQRCRTAATLPGVGFERAIAAANHFTSVREMINADAVEWAKVPGVGKTIAKTVVEAVR